VKIDKSGEKPQTNGDPSGESPRGTPLAEPGPASVPEDEGYQLLDPRNARPASGGYWKGRH